nr:MAG TPA: adenine specific DNA methyltransferase [Caudoviricetes sp.]
MQVVMKSLEEIQPYSKNAKKHDARQIKNVAESIKQYGFVQPVVVDKNNIIVIGHCRALAAKKLGIKEVPCVCVDDLTPEQVNALRLVDNKSNESDWDFDLLKDELPELDLSAFDFDWGLPEIAEEVIEDEAPEVDEDAEPIVKLGDIWQLGRHRLMCGDSTDKETVELLMDGKKADMVFTDPPYGVSYTGGLQFKDGYVEKNNREMIKNDDIDIYEDVFKILSQFSNGACYIWFAGTKAASLYSAAEKYGEIHALIIWVKNGGYGALNANYKQKHEPCLYWKPKNAKLNFCGDTTQTTVWEINKDGVNEFHPTQKPIALPSKAIKNHKAETVLDLFGGSGSTLIACEQLGRTCYMMELDPKYCDVIIKRWENLTGEKAVLVNDN